MAEVKIKPNDEQEFKQFQVDIKDIGWRQRCKLNDAMIKENGNGKMPSFSWWGAIVLEFTELKEIELNKYSTDEIIAIANTVFEVANKKNR